jgi:DNA-binding response OmpR family regulator
MQALLISPHADETALLNLLLQQAGFSVRSQRQLKNALKNWHDQPCDFVLVCNLPGDSEIAESLRELRVQTPVPMVVLADAVSEDQQVAMLEAGADLVVTRPYSVRILVAEIKALMRRSAGMPFFSLPVIHQREVELDPSRRTVRVQGGEPRRLTQLEFRLLYTLMINAGQIIPTDNIVEHVWGFPGDGSRELVRGLVQRLRNKVEPQPGQPRYILTEPGVGYYFEL